MQPAHKNLPATRPSQPSTAVSNSFDKPNSEQLAMARKTLASLMKGRPEANAENPKYLAEMVEVLAWTTPEEQSWLTHPRTGLHTTLKFLPTPADVHTFIRETRARKEQFAPAPTAYRKIEDDPDAPWNRETDAERKRRVVEKVLGYNPEGRTQKRGIEPGECTGKLELKTPAAPVSDALKALLRAQGYAHIRDDA